ncbi:MAG: hypothetical protein WCI60_00660 [bacterium]
MSNYSEKIPDTEAKNTSWYKIMSFVPESSEVIDIGCSSGLLGKALKENKNCTV